MERNLRMPLPDEDEPVDNVLRLSQALKERPSPRFRPQSRGHNDWAFALEAVYRAAESMRTVEERARETEARSMELVEKAIKELKTAESRLQAAESAGAAAAERARDAEMRAAEAEEWLKRLHDAIIEQLISGRGREGQRSPGVAA
ncbi:MAG TPA: hypothetical protein VFQ27_06065 [Xanthobacteraceae bacterium]|nr:hypothetical protein [Xanthobacteraceae bacterium]